MANNQEQLNSSRQFATPEQCSKVLSGQTRLFESSDSPSLSILSPATVTCKSLQKTFDNLRVSNNKTQKTTKTNDIVRYDDMYTTVKVLSKTIFGNMRIALHRKTKKIRAVKMFNKILMQRHATGGTAVRENFDVELKLMKWLRKFPHEGLIAASPENEQVEDARYKYIVMPLASEGDLLGFVNKNKGTISDNIVRDIFLQLISALQHLHKEAGYIHGDVSAENILLSYDETGRLRVQLCDYGLACKIGARHHCCGKKGYLSPEQYSKQVPTVDPTSDVFSLAIVMFVLYYGIPPFKAATQSDIYYDGLEKKCKFRASAFSSWLCAWGIDKKRSEWALLPTILSMLKRDPRQRPTLASIKEIVEGWKNWY